MVNETVWLTIDQMATLFQRNKSTISRHIRDAFECGELNPDSTVAFFATVQKEGERNVSRDIQYYNLDMIISVGYRVHSLRGVQFRMWATRTLKEYLIKGFAMNDELQAKEHKPMYMSDWIQRLDDFLKLSGKELLQHAGTISAKLAKEKADAEYNKFEERTRNELSPVELHFIENFERERQKLVSGSSHPALPDEQS